MFKLGRKPLRVKWTEAYRKEKGSAVKGSEAEETTVESAPVEAEVKVETKVETKKAPAEKAKK